jgi:hypothetical protein
MKKTIAITLLALSASLALTGCYRKAQDEFVEIKPDETAFLVSLEGDTKTNQAKFDSVAVMEEHKISAKRVIIPHKLLNTCPSCTTAEYVDVPTARLFTVTRKMVSREWTATDKGTKKENQAISVESNESIDFDLGVMITAHIAESDTATFLYNYSGSQLSDIMDGDVRSIVGKELADQFGTHSLEEDRHDKIAYFHATFDKVAKFFKDKGITIDSLGSAEGMTYHDKAIQTAINNKFAAEMSKAAARDQADAAAILVANKDAVLMQQNFEIRKRELDIEELRARKFNGVLPTTVMLGTGQTTIMGVPLK